MIDKFKKEKKENDAVEIHTHHHSTVDNFMLYVLITGFMVLPFYANTNQLEKYKAEKGEDYKEWKFYTRSLFASFASGWFVEPIIVGSVIYDYVTEKKQGYIYNDEI